MTTPSMSVNFHNPERARISDHDTFCVLTVDGGYMEAKFYIYAPAADVQSIADAFNAVLSPKAEDTQDAE
jgi:hypothetical protein